MSFDKAMKSHKEKTIEKKRDGLAESLFTIKVNGRVLSSEDWTKDTGHLMRSTNKEIFPGELDMFRDWALCRVSDVGSQADLSNPNDKFWSTVGTKSCCPPDMVNHPSHYTAGGIETLDFVREKLNANTAIDHWQAYCFGNALKYITRAGLKGDMKEDIKKAIFYLRSAIGDDPR